MDPSISPRMGTSCAYLTPQALALLRALVKDVDLELQSRAVIHCTWSTATVNRMRLHRRTSAQHMVDYHHSTEVR